MGYTITREQAKETIKRIRSLIQQYFKENNLTYAVFGKSEGLDSSVIAGLLSKLEGVRPVGVIMPCESSPDAERIARIVLEHFNIPFVKIELSQAYHNIKECLEVNESIEEQLGAVLKSYSDIQAADNFAVHKAKAHGNIKVRLRMITLYHIAQILKGIVISTDNLSELWMGFWTLNGDVGDFAPIQHIWKGIEEYTIAEELGVPEESLNAIPTDGLDVVPGGTDEDQLGLPYHDLDRVIVNLLQNGFDGNEKWSIDKMDALAQKISDKLEYPIEKITHAANQMRATSFKRKWPKVLRRSDIKLLPVDDIDI